MSSEWIKPKNKKTAMRQTSNRKLSERVVGLQNSCADTTALDQEKLRLLILATEEKISSTEFLRDLFDNIKHIVSFGDINIFKLLVLGIGSFRDSISILQFSLALKLRSQLQSLCGNCVRFVSEIFDPMCSESDKVVFNEYAFQFSDKNLVGKYPIDEKEVVFFFMPHCPYRLYNNVLWSSWFNLARVFILGNSFESYSLREIHRGDDEADCIKLLQRFCNELACWIPSKHSLRKGSHASEISQLEFAFIDTRWLYYGSTLNVSILPHNLCRKISLLMPFPFYAHHLV